jgi:HD-GYP domain-containing protein (c-di-GMP phosphodiesterase class II)/DNA-binding CsgD family transcriptional regulator
VNTAAPSVRRNEVIGVLSLATDFAIGQPLGYGLRSAVASVALARSMGLHSSVQGEAYYHGLLRYCGCTAETDKLNALFGDEIAIRKNFSAIDPADGAEFVRVLMSHVGPARADHPPLTHGDANFMNVVGQTVGVFSAHCEVAARIGARLGLSRNVQNNLRQLYERWDGHGFPNHLAGEAIAMPVRLVLVVQDALALLDIMPVERVGPVIAGRSGGPYDPAVVDAFLPILPQLLAPASDEEIWAAAMACDAGEDAILTEEQIDAASEVIADFIDLKSPLIAGHSRAVAALVDDAARVARMAGAARAEIRRAALWHDIGYIAIGGTARFDPAEGSERSRLHPYFAGRMVPRAPGLAAVGAIIAEHHERLDGSGFHRGVRASDLSAPGRLLAVAEAYQNLVEDRPFRVTLTPAQAAARLREEVKRGTLDGEAVAAVLEAAGQGSRGKKIPFVAGLTAREIDVLRRVVRGGTTKEIAGDLGLSPKTVDNHIQSIYGKAGVNTRGGATLFALEHGLLKPGSN